MMFFFCLYKSLEFLRQYVYAYIFTDTLQSDNKTAETLYFSRPKCEIDEWKKSLPDKSCIPPHDV
jgi:predicted nucleotidyltransferase